MNIRLIRTTLGFLLATSCLAHAFQIDDLTKIDLLSGYKENVSTDGIGFLEFEVLLDYHRNQLDKYYLPYWSDGRIDFEFGGFIPEFDPNAPRRTRYTKETYTQGRGLWLFAYLYNHYSGESTHLRAASKAKDFLLSYMLRDDGMFFEEASRSGEILHEYPNIYGDIYIFMGLAEYYRATGDTDAREQAIRTALTVFDRAKSPDYLHAYQNHGRAGAREGRSEEYGIQRLGTWQHFLGALTKTLEIIPDERLHDSATFAVDRVLRFHYDPEHRVGWENLPFDGTPPDEFRYTGIVSNFHTIQAAWMAMAEAVRRGDQRMFVEAMEMGRTYVPYVYERSRMGVGGFTDELLLFLAIAYEHTLLDEFADWFAKTWELVAEHSDWNRRDLLHHPRRLLFMIELLERMQERNGRVSGFLKGYGEKEE